MEHLVRAQSTGFYFLQEHKITSICEQLWLADAFVACGPGRYIYSDRSVEATEEIKSETSPKRQVNRQQNLQGKLHRGVVHTL